MKLHTLLDNLSKSYLAIMATYYTIEQPETFLKNNWYCTKWPSGEFECYGGFDIYITSHSKKENIYQAIWEGTLEFPITFPGAPKIVVTNSTTDTAYYVASVAFVVRDINKIYQMYFQRATAFANNAKISLNIIAKGRWK